MYAKHLPEQAYEKPYLDTFRPISSPLLTAVDIHSIALTSATREVINLEFATVSCGNMLGTGLASTETIPMIENFLYLLTSCDRSIDPRSFIH